MTPSDIVSESPTTLQSVIENLEIENGRIHKKILEHESQMSRHRWGGHTLTIRASGLSQEKRKDLEKYLRSFMTSMERRRTADRFANRRRGGRSPADANERTMGAPCRRDISRLSKRVVMKSKPPPLVPSASMEYEGDDELDMEVEV